MKNDQIKYVALDGKMDAEKIKPYFDGEISYKNGNPETSCPYIFDTVSGKLWLEGYMDAKKLNKLNLLY